MAEQLRTRISCPHENPFYYLDVPTTRLKIPVAKRTIKKPQDFQDLVFIQ
jgi:hypothetical protein